MIPPATDILDALPDPTILLDGRRTVMRANPAARQVLGPDLTGRDLSNGMRHPQMLAAVDAVLEGGAAQQAEVELWVPVARTFEVQVLPAPDGRDGALLLLRDITAIRHSERMQEEFVANVSHELRSPLSTLVGFIETLQGPADGDPEARARFLDIMGGEAARMSRLVEDLLSLARVQTMEHIQPATTIELSVLIAGVLDALGPLAAAHGAELVSELGGGALPVIGDGDELTQLFQNLVDNAVKYAGGRIRVSAEPVDRIPDIGSPGIRVSVGDNGPGIAETDLPRLTERFYRVDKGRSRRLGGTGLGLAIVKHIVSRHRGRLIPASRPGRGSTFSVYLPRAPGASPNHHGNETNLSSS